MQCTDIINYDITPPGASIQRINHTSIMPASYFKSTKTQRGKESEREKESERGARHPRGRAPAHYDRTVRRNDHGLEERYRTNSEELRMERRALREQTQAAQAKLVEIQKELTMTQAHAMSLLFEMQAIKTSLATHEEEPDAACGLFCILTQLGTDHSPHQPSSPRSTTSTARLSNSH